MDGLIKGLIDVALGGGNNDGGERRDNREDSQSSSDQRSRSTWAEVLYMYTYVMFFLWQALFF